MLDNVMQAIVAVNLVIIKRTAMDDISLCVGHRLGLIVPVHRGRKSAHTDPLHEYSFYLEVHETYPLQLTSL